VWLKQSSHHWATKSDSKPNRRHRNRNFERTRNVGSTRKCVNLWGRNHMSIGPRMIWHLFKKQAPDRLKAIPARYLLMWRVRRKYANIGVK
jgi:hypothetical protein